MLFGILSTFSCVPLCSFVFLCLKIGINYLTECASVTFFFDFIKIENRNRIFFSIFDFDKFESGPMVPRFSRNLAPFIKIEIQNRSSHFANLPWHRYKIPADRSIPVTFDWPCSARKKTIGSYQFHSYLYDVLSAESCKVVLDFWFGNLK